MRRTTDEPIIWFSFRGPDGRAWWVVLATPEMTPTLREKRAGKVCCGITIYAHNVIVIHAGMPLRGWAETLTHEFCHVALEHEQVARAREERLVQAASPGLCAIASQFGMAFPPVPPEAMRMHRRWMAAQRKGAA